MTDTSSVLRRITSERPQPPGERCEMCAAPISDEHSHVVNVRTRALLCTCRPCALLFDRPDAHLAFTTVPDRYLALPGFVLSRAQWDELAIPVGVAFVFRNTALGRVVAFYPGPAGATESELSMAAWDEIVAANPALTTLRDDVEAALLRVGDDEVQCFVVPIDACYELVGHLRMLWRGFDGGSQAHERLAEFFDRIAARCVPA